MNINEGQSIWIEKYRPTCTDDLVLPDYIKAKFKKYAENEDIPNLGLFSANPGTGKTSSAVALVKEINGEALFINASLDRGIDVLRNQISNFASTESFDGKLKIVIMDEIDAISQDAQFAFRALIESFANNCRFIFTANFKEKLIDPLLDRLECYDFNSFDKKQMVKPIFEHLKNILYNEKVLYDPKDLVPVINTFYPSIRGMVGALQKFSISGTLVVNETELDNQDEYTKIMDLVLQKNFNAVINAVNDLNSPDNMYSYMYKKLSSFKNLAGSVIIIARYQFQSSSVRDKNLNLSACLTELMNVN